MRIEKIMVFLMLLISFNQEAFTQAPGINWQKCLGTYDSEGNTDVILTPDGGYFTLTQSIWGVTTAVKLDAAGNITWQTILSTNLGLYTLSASPYQTYDGGYLIFGQLWLDPNEQNIDCWLMKLNTDGVIQWERSYGGSTLEYPKKILQTADGGYIFTASSDSNNGDVSGNHGGADAWVVKTDASGNLLWQKCYGGSGSDDFFTLIPASDGGYVLLGSTSSNDGDVSGNHGSYDVWLAKINDSGDLQWQKCFGGSNDDFGNRIVEASNGGYILRGRTKSNNGDVSGHHGGSDVWMVKTDISGNLQWQKCIGGSSDDSLSDIILTSDGGYILVGYTESSNGDFSGNHGGFDAWMAKMNTSGALQWIKNYGGSGNDLISDILPSGNDYIMMGWTKSNDGDVGGNHGDYDVWMVKTNSSGNILWQHCYGGSGDDKYYSVKTYLKETYDGGYIFSTTSNSNNGDVSGTNGSYDAWVVKLGEEVNCPDLNATATLTHPACSGSSTGAISITPPNNGTSPYSYLWSTGATTKDISGLTAGTYNLTITDGASCASTFSYTLTDPSPLVLTVNSSGVSCYGDADGTATAVITGGTPGYTYLWSTGSTSSTINNQPAGSYSVTVTDSKGCTVSSTVTIESPAPLEAIPTIEDVLCFGDNNGSIYIVMLGGTSPHSYLWNDGSTSDHITNLTSGVYTVTITDDHGCYIHETYIITEPDQLITVVNKQDVTVPGGSDGSASVDVSGGTSPYSFLWSTGATGSSVSNLSAGDYTVTITDANGCKNIESFTILDSGCTLSAQTSFTAVSCFGGNDGSASVSYSGQDGNVTFLWSNGATTQTISGLTAGNYSVTVSDNTCAVHSSVIVTSPAQIHLTTSSEPTECNGSTGKATVLASGGVGGFSYHWNNGATLSSIESLAAGVYTVTVNDSNGCTALASVTVSSNDTIPPALLHDSDTLYLDASGQISDFSPLEDNFEDNCGSNISIQVLNDTIFDCSTHFDYTILVNVQDDAGNEAVYSVNVTLIDTIQPVFVNCQTDIIQGNCQGSTVLFDEPKVSDNCLVSSLTQTSGLSSGSEFPLGTTLIEWTATDISGNTSKCSFNVIIKEGLVIQSDVRQVSCHGQNDASIRIDTAALEKPYSILWSTGDSTNVINNLEPGLYSVTVSSNGCTSSSNFSITEPESIVIELDSIHNASSTVLNDGFIHINVSGGTEPYSFKWYLNGAEVGSDQNIENLFAGDYTLIITDANGCNLESTTYTVGVTSATHGVEKAIIKLYPDPAMSILNFSEKLKDIKIISSSGSLIAAHPNTRISIDVSALPSGTYYLTAKTLSGQIVNGRFVKL